VGGQLAEGSVRLLVGPQGGQRVGVDKRSRPRS
jgi:hypothetical protein